MGWRGGGEVGTFCAVGAEWEREREGEVLDGVFGRGKDGVGGVGEVR